jgi:hypothetical protein
MKLMQINPLSSESLIPIFHLYTAVMICGPIGILIHSRRSPHMLI